MMIYLTGAGNSLAKSSSSSQNDAGKSLGGFISSSPVPNGAINELFDLLSAQTLSNRQAETIAIGLVNKFDYPVKDVELKIVTRDDNIASFKVGAVEVDKSDYQMEHISSRYQEPLSTQFFDASFYRTGVNIEIKFPGIVGEEIMLYPFNVIVNITEEGINGTWEAFEEAFADDENYSVRRISETIFRIEKRDEVILEVPVVCSYLSSDSSFSAEFLGKLENKADNSVLIKDTLNPNEAVGIWIQRQVKKNKYASDTELMKEFVEKYVREDSEEVELVISYNLLESYNNYNEEAYEPESHS